MHFIPSLSYSCLFPSLLVFTSVLSASIGFSSLVDGLTADIKDCNGDEISSNLTQLKHLPAGKSFTCACKTSFVVKQQNKLGLKTLVWSPYVGYL